MGDQAPDLTPFDIVVLLEDEWLLRPVLDAFLAGERSPAELATPHGREAVDGFESFFAVLTARSRRPFWHGRERRWLLLGPVREHRAVPEELDADLSYPSPATDEARLQRLAERYAWALAPWYSTYQEGTLVFVATDPGTARRFASCVERVPAVEVTGGGSHRRDLLLTQASGVARLDDAARFVLFDDAALRDGWLAWQMAREEGAAPLLFSEQTEHTRPRWRRAERRLEIAAEATARRSDGATRHVIYRPLDARTFDAVLFRGAWGDLPDAILPGAADPHAVLETTISFAASELVQIESLRKLERLAACAGWAQGYSIGGGSSEYHAVFCARDPRVAARFWQRAAGARPDGADRRIGRF